VKILFYLASVGQEANEVRSKPVKTGNLGVHILACFGVVEQEIAENIRMDAFADQDLVKDIIETGVVSGLLLDIDLLDDQSKDMLQFCKWEQAFADSDEIGDGLGGLLIDQDILVFE
jgi:hypothetical protein